VRSGEVAEEVIAAALKGVGIVFDRQVRVGISIFGYELFADFVLLNLADYPDGLALESKWQDRDGTIDEKFPYVADNIIERYTVPAIVVAHGGGQRPGAIEYLRSRCDSKKLIAVFPFEKFLSWAIRARRNGRREIYGQADR